MNVEEKNMLQNRKLRNLKNFFFRVNDSIEQHLLNVSIREKLKRLAAENTNSINSLKYGYNPNAINEKAAENKDLEKFL